MTKYKTDIAAAAASMMELPGTLEGMLHDIHGQVEVPSIASSTSPTEAKKKNSSKTSAKVLEQPKIMVMPYGQPFGNNVPQRANSLKL